NLNGDFSALLDANSPDNSFHRVIRVADPRTGQPFPGNIIPTDRFDPASLNLARFLPTATGTGQVFFPSPTAQDTDELVLRGDHSLSSGDRLTARYYADRIELQPQFDPHNIIVYSLGYDIPVKNLLLQETHVFRSNLLNEMRFAWSTVPVGKIAPPDSPSPA